MSADVVVRVGPPGAAPRAAERPAPDSTSSPAAVRVPWGLVLSCALVMALLDGFVVVALRGVAGSIERTDHLAASWVVEVLLLLPTYVAAVLGAVMLVSGQRNRRRPHRHPTLWMLAAIALAGTVVAVTWAATSAAYDLRLQRHELLDMPAMQASCTGTCPAQMQHAALVLQERALGLAAVAFVVGNLVMVLWVYALRGGVLVPAPRPVAPSTLAPTGTPSGSGQGRRRRRTVRPDRRADLRWVMAASLLGTAVIHLAVVPEHLAQWPLSAVFFVLLSVAEVGAARLVFRRRSTVVVVAIGLLSVLPLLLWGVTRTRGLPFGPEPRAAEAVGLADLAACSLEVVTLAACLLAVCGAAWLRRPTVGPYAFALGLTTVVAVTTLALGGTGLPVVHAFGVAGHAQDENQTYIPSQRLPGSLVPPSQLEPGSR